MSTFYLSAYIGKTICVYDSRTGVYHSETIKDAKELWGRLRLCLNHIHGECTETPVWFEPTRVELDSITF
jgi:hypothetical protein